MIEGYEQIVIEKLPKKEWDRILDKFLSSNYLIAKEFESLGEEKLYSQKDIIQEVKRSVKRINYKLRRQK